MISWKILNASFDFPNTATNAKKLSNERNQKPIAVNRFIPRDWQITAITAETDAMRSMKRT
jgi:hypothetical protein